MECHVLFAVQRTPEFNIEFRVADRLPEDPAVVDDGKDRCIKTINEMLRSTILVESAKDYVSINSFIYPYILNYFQHNKLI